MKDNRLDNMQLARMVALLGIQPLPGRVSAQDAAQPPAAGPVQAGLSLPVTPAHFSQVND